MTTHNEGLLITEAYWGLQLSSLANSRFFFGCLRRYFLSSGPYSFEQYLFVCLVPKPQNQPNFPLWKLVKLLSPHFLKSNVWPFFLDFGNPLGTIMERNCFRFETFVHKWHKIAAHFIYNFFCGKFALFAGFFATIRIGREMVCLPGFFKPQIDFVQILLGL